MSNGNNRDGDWVTASKSSSSNGGISPLELESLTQLDEEEVGDHMKNSKRNLDRLAAASSSLPHHPCDKVALMVKLAFELYPKLMFGSLSFCLGGFLVWLSPWKSWSNAHWYSRNYMSEDYTALTDNFNFQAAQIDHWCLFGGDDRCYCEDPTEGQSRVEVRGWTNAHQRNQQLVTQAMNEGGTGVDVVFLGDQTVQTWDGYWLDKPAPEGRQVAQYFNQTFNSPDSPFRGVALGIYGDRLNNILWRIQHGEVPASLLPKVFWLVMGTNDLALGLCSEEVVTLGIMRVAEELHHLYPESIVVIQGILPRSNHRDGSLDGKTKKYASREAPGRTPGQVHRHHIFGRDRNKKGDNRREKREKNKKKEDDSGGGDSGGQTRRLGDGADMDEMEVIETQDEVDGDVEAAIENYNRYLESTTETTTTYSNRVSGKHSDTQEKKTVRKAEEEQSSGNDKDVRKGFTYKDTDTVIAKDEARRSPQPRFDYYLWPSIQAVNKELEGFCAKHEHLLYFDADDLILGSVGNAHYRAPHRTIITELMPNYVHLSYLGHKVVLDTVNEELKRIIMDDDENNDIETKTGSKTSSDNTDGGKR